MPDDPKDPAPAPAPAAAAKPAYTIAKQTKSRWWEVRDPDDELVCLTVYRKGAREVMRRDATPRRLTQTRMKHTAAAGEIACAAAMLAQRPNVRHERRLADGAAGGKTSGRWRVRLQATRHASR